MSSKRRRGKVRAEEKERVKAASAARARTERCLENRLRQSVEEQREVEPDGRVRVWYVRGEEVTKKAAMEEARRLEREGRRWVDGLALDGPVITGPIFPPSGKDTPRDRIYERMLEHSRDLSAPLPDLMERMRVAEEETTRLDPGEHREFHRLWKRGTDMYMITLLAANDMRNMDGLKSIKRVIEGGCDYDPGGALELCPYGECDCGDGSGVGIVGSRKRRWVVGSRGITTWVDDMIGMLATRGVQL